MPLSKRYILFSQEEHERVNLDVTYAQLEKFILMWDAGFHINTIYRNNNTSRVTAALMVMDLEMTGAIKKRKKGLEGWRDDSEYREWYESIRNELL